MTRMQDLSQRQETARQATLKAARKAAGKAAQKAAGRAATERELS